MTKEIIHNSERLMKMVVKIWQKASGNKPFRVRQFGLFLV